MTQAITASEALPRALPKTYTPIQIIGKGGMGVVYEVVDRLRGQVVALKQLQSDVSQDRASIAREFKMLSLLRHPYVLPAYDFGFDAEGHPYFTMPLLAQPTTVVDYAARQPFSIQVSLVSQMVEALKFLHQHQVIHNDLKPNNILVIDGRVQLLDFGLSSILGERLTHSAGTVRYLAPERLRGGKPTPASDFYALGVVAFEIFAANTDLAEIVLREPPAPHHARRLPTEPHVQEWVARLLSDNPRERLLDVASLVRSDDKQIASFTIEPVAQESVLQSAPFVGRSRELTALHGALRALHDGKGGLWLIGGESGIGKSRLLEELRVEALISHVTVLRGQATSDINRPYQWLEETLNWLRLVLDVDEHEYAILRMALPESAQPAQETLPPDPQDAERRLLDVIEALFRRNPAPLLVLLEDIHWLTPESLLMLSKLTQRLSDDPTTLFIASYRHDEQPALRSQFPHAQSLVLERLPPSHVRSLVETITGQRVTDTFLLSIEQETEGNPFFIVEVMRALADASGGLSQIAVDAAPSPVFAIGRDNVLQRRVEALPPFARALLPLAAVIGRTLDLPLLRRLRPDVDMDRWLAVCAEAVVLEAQGSDWRFAHDRIRENLLNRLSETERQSLHREVAQALEHDRADDDLTLPALVFHWQQADALEKEAHYAARAGAVYIWQNNYGAAVRYLRRAVELEAYIPPGDRAINENLLGEALYASGYMADGEKHLSRALAGYGVAPVSPLQILRQVLVQTWLRLARTHSRPTTFAQQAVQRAGLMMRACEKLGQIYYVRNDRFPAIYYALKGLNLSEQLGVGARSEQARFYGSMALGFSFLSQHRLARYYLNMADTVSKDSDNLDALAWTYEATGTYLAGCGRWREAEARYRDCIRASRETGNKRRQLETIGFLAALYGQQARWDALEQLYAEFDAVDPYKDDHQARPWHLVPRGTQALLKGNAEAAFEWVTELETLVDRVDEAATQMRVLGLLTLYYLHYQVGEVADAYAQRLIQTIIQTSPVVFPMLDGYVACAAFFLRALALHPSPEKQMQARRACAALQTFSRGFAIGQPYALTMGGWYWLLRGSPAKSARLSDRAIQSARQLELPIAEAAACALVRRALPDHDSRSVAATQRADVLRQTTQLQIEHILPL